MATLAGMAFLILVISTQIWLLIYHQVTTWFDLSPFNGARHYTRKERFAETSVNGVLMALPPIGYALHIHGLMTFGVIYYFVLFAFEIIIWWIPYFTRPEGRWLTAYNGALALATSNVTADPLRDWISIHQRIHADTLIILPKTPDRIVPNVEHMILHGWTLLTAITTGFFYFY